MNTEILRSFAESISVESLGELVADVADIGLDGAISSGVLDGVPVVGTIMGLWQAGRDIQHALFVRKICRFLAGASKATITQRAKFVEILRENNKIDEFGEAILLILDRIDDTQKPEMIGNIMAAHMSGNLDYDVAMRISSAINKVFVQDLDSLRTFDPESAIQDRAVAESLFSAGLASMYNGNGGWFSPEMAGSQIYKLNKYGKFVKLYALV